VPEGLLDDHARTIGAAALRELGAYLTGTEARQIADRLEDDDPLSAALTAGTITSEELVRRYLVRIASYDQAGPSLNSSSSGR